MEEYLVTRKDYNEDDQRVDQVKRQNSHKRAEVQRVTICKDTALWLRILKDPKLRENSLQ